VRTIVPNGHERCSPLRSDDSRRRSHRSPGRPAVSRPPGGRRNQRCVEIDRVTVVGDIDHGVVVSRAAERLVDTVRRQSESARSGNMLSVMPRTRRRADRVPAAGAAWRRTWPLSSTQPSVANGDRSMGHNRSASSAAAHAAVMSTSRSLHRRDRRAARCRRGHTWSSILRAGRREGGHRR
jgi:hypothetical protein